MFDDARLDDTGALAAVDPSLRRLAESGARVRREVVATADAIDSLPDANPSRAMVVVGRDARLARAVLEPWCPIPFVAWSGPGLPGWAGPLDLVVALAQDEADEATVTALTEAVRRGCTVVVACPPDSTATQVSAGRYTTVLPATGDDTLAGTVVLLNAVHRMGLGPQTDAEEVASALDEVAAECSPYADLASNPAKAVASAVGDETPLLWGGSVLAARAARRVAEAIRRTTGRIALAGEAEHLLPVIEATTDRDLFADPFEDGPESRSCVLVLDDGTEERAVVEQRSRLADACERRDVRLESMSRMLGSPMARYASLLVLGGYAAVYLGVALDAGGDGTV